MQKLSLCSLAAAALAAVAVLIGAPSTASAQSICTTYAYTTDYGYGWFPPEPPGAHDCFATGPESGTIVCTVNTYRCPPAAAQAENPRCIECERMAAISGSPINLATGDVYVDQTDLSIPGLGGGLRLTRSWNSLWPYTQSGFRTGMFGPNWRSTYEEKIFTGSDGFIKYLRSDGNFWSFGYNGSNWLVSAPANQSAVLTQNATSWILTFKNGESKTFDINTGVLTSISDRNGNTTSLAYDGLNRLTTVTDPASRHLTFTYTGSSSYLVAGVSSDAGLSLAYSYDGSGRLLQVTKPDQSKLVFEYDSGAYYYPTLPNPYITAIKDGNGKLIESHQYDCYGRGLTSSRAGGVDSIVVTYSDGTYSGSCTIGRYFASE